MVSRGKYEVLGIKISACDYSYILHQIEESLKRKRRLLIFPSASHSLVQSVFDKRQKASLRKFDYIVPDSQWLRHSLGFLFGVWLQDRVYGPELTLRICRLAEDKGYKIHLLGRSENVILKLTKKLMKIFPKIKLATGLTQAQIVLVGLGSPYQEVYTATNFGKKKIVAIPVGAAFDYLSSEKSQAPYWMQKAGFEWFFRLLKEPRRLWKRYLIYAPLFVFLVLYQKLLLGIKSTLR